MLTYMHMSDPSRGVVSKGLTAKGSLSSKAGWGDDCDCYCKGWPSKDGSREHSPCSRPFIES